MRYFRMLSNAVAGGALGAAFLTVLVLQLNPQIPLGWWTVWPLYWRIALFYASHLTVGFYALLVIRQLFGRTIHSPGWLSFRILSWIGTLVVSVAAALMWFNASGFQAVLDQDTIRRLAAGAGATTVCAVLLAIITIVHYSFGRRGSRVGGTLLVLTLVASLLFPVTARGWGKPRPLPSRLLDLDVVEAEDPPGPRVVMILLDGASLDYVSLETAEGRLPNIARILAGGASMHLTTVQPTQPAPVWAAVATGKYPQKNGIRAASGYAYAKDRPMIELLPDLCFAHALVHFGMLRQVPHRSTSILARPIWSILSREHVSSGVLGWPVTTPALPLRGFLITDTYRQPAFGTPDDLTLGYPAYAVASALMTDALAAGAAPPRTLEHPPLARDAHYRRLADILGAQIPTRFFAVRYEGLDQAGHLFLRYALPRAFGDVSEEEQQRYGGVLDEHYAYIDTVIGDAIESLRPDDLLLIVSGFGMEPVSLGKRLLAAVLTQPSVTGTHERAPDGFLLAYGGAVRPGRLPLGAVVDVAPTILYFLGLPVARDMDGSARTDIFAPAFLTAKPITFIPTYER